MQATDKGAETSAGLNVIALVSGGKDSLYSILHCIRNGHKVVALANLHPAIPASHHGRYPQEEVDDIDSFMYQTIGYSVIPLYESALGIPLYRAPITGKAIDTSRIYRHDGSPNWIEDGRGQGDSIMFAGIDADETESLVPLLERIMKHHPQANAVSAGAILSTYQRTRIENVAYRLGLIPLAWLWMYTVLPPPMERDERSKLSPIVADAGLLEDMAACKCEARIIKVASGGLDTRFLWGDVASSDGDVRRVIVKAMRRFAKEDLRGAVLGEGGEYETLALDGPGFLWRQKIVVEETESRTGEGGVAYMRLVGAKCVPKTALKDGLTPEAVPRPASMDEEFVSQMAWLTSVNYGDSNMTPEIVQLEKASLDSSISQNELKQNQTWTISNITAPEAGSRADQQMKAIVEKTEAILLSAGETGISARSAEDIVFATVLLRSMADFALVNRVYSSLFKKPNPPARVTVACGADLPEGVGVMASFAVDMGSRNLREGLHVQSRSYWAPANIGPYSQAISVPLTDNDRMVYVAGQIPLDPATMELARSSGAEHSWLETYSLHAVLSLQHLWRIGSAMHVDWWAGAVAFLAGNDYMEIRSRIAWNLWQRLHTQKEHDDNDDDESALDVWDIKYGRKIDEHSSDPRRKLPNFSILHSKPIVPPFFAVQVSELPRSSDIEWQSAGLKCSHMSMTERQETHGKRIECQMDDTAVFTGIEIDLEQSDAEVLDSIQQIVQENMGKVSFSVIYTPFTLPYGLWNGQIVPCRSVWGTHAQKLAAGIMLQRAR